jgi:hypothetical protein
LPKEALAKLREEVEMAKGLCPPFDAQAYPEGHLTPVHVGSAFNNFGGHELRRGVAELAPPVDGFVPVSTPAGQGLPNGRYTLLQGRARHLERGWILQRLIFRATR